MTKSATDTAQWHIQLCETRAHWAYLHHIGFGRPVYHTFLRLVGPGGVVDQEIHGGAALLEDGRARRISTGNFLKSATRAILMNGSLPDFALLARVHDGYYRAVRHVHDIVSGDEAPVLELWAGALDLTRRFNQNAPVYNTRRLNCNSLTHTLARAVGTMPQRLTYAPGFDNPAMIAGPVALPPAVGDVPALRNHIRVLSRTINRPFDP